MPECLKSLEDYPSKIVAAASRRFVIVADHTKRVTQLGSKAPVPVEVIPFAERPVADYLISLGARVEKRMDRQNTLGSLHQLLLVLSVKLKKRNE